MIINERNNPFLSDIIFCPYLIRGTSLSLVVSGESSKVTDIIPEMDLHKIVEVIRDAVSYFEFRSTLSRLLYQECLSFIENVLELLKIQYIQIQYHLIILHCSILIKLMWCYSRLYQGVSANYL